MTQEKRPAVAHAVSDQPWLTIGKPVFWQIPNDQRSVTESRNNGVPLVQHAPRSKAQQSIQGLVQALYRKEGQAAATKSRRWFWQTSS